MLITQTIIVGEVQPGGDVPWQSAALVAIAEHIERTSVPFEARLPIIAKKMGVTDGRAGVYLRDALKVIGTNVPLRPREQEALTIYQSLEPPMLFEGTWHDGTRWSVDFAVRPANDDESKNEPVGESWDDPVGE